MVILLKFSHWTCSSHGTWSIATLDGYSNGLKEKEFGTSFTMYLISISFVHSLLTSFSNDASIMHPCSIGSWHFGKSLLCPKRLCKITGRHLLKHLSLSIDFVNSCHDKQSSNFTRSLGFPFWWLYSSCFMLMIAA